MSTVHDQFVGVADEATYGTLVAPDTFYEILEDGVSGSYERIESEGIRGPLLRADRFAPNPKGAAGDFSVEVLDKGFDFWLQHMVGEATTVSGVTTATPGDLSGKSFSYQAARYASGTDTLIPFAYAGGKVASWELSAEVDGILKCKVTLDFASEQIDGTGAAALAVPAYPVETQLLTFIGATASVGGSGFPVNSVSLTGANGLKVDRYSMRGATSTTKREPKQSEMQEYALTLGAEFEDASHSQRIASAIAAGTLAEVVLHFDSPQGGTLEVSLPAVRFDEGNVNAARELTTQELTTKVVAPADNSDALSLVYTEASEA